MFSVPISAYLNKLYTRSGFQGSDVVILINFQFNTLYNIRPLVNISFYFSLWRQTLCVLCVLFTKTRKNKMKNKTLVNYSSSIYPFANSMTSSVEAASKPNIPTHKQLLKAHMLTAHRRSLKKYSEKFRKVTCTGASVYKVDQNSRPSALGSLGPLYFFV